MAILRTSYGETINDAPVALVAGEQWSYTAWVRMSSADSSCYPLNLGRLYLECTEDGVSLMDFDGPALVSLPTGLVPGVWALVGVACSYDPGMDTYTVALFVNEDAATATGAGCPWEDVGWVRINYSPTIYDPRCDVAHPALWAELLNDSNVADLYGHGWNYDLRDWSFMPRHWWPVSRPDPSIPVDIVPDRGIGELSPLKLYGEAKVHR